MSQYESRLIMAETGKQLGDQMQSARSSSEACAQKQGLCHGQKWHMVRAPAASVCISPGEMAE